MATAEQRNQAQVELNEWSQRTGVAVPDMSQGAHDYLISDGVTAAQQWERINVNNSAWGQNAGQPNNAVPRPAGGPFGDPGVTQQQADEANYFNRKVVAIGKLRERAARLREQGRHDEAKEIDDIAALMT